MRVSRQKPVVHVWTLVAILTVEFLNMDSIVRYVRSRASLFILCFLFIRRILILISTVLLKTLTSITKVLRPRHSPFACEFKFIKV